MSENTPNAHPAKRKTRTSSFKKILTGPEFDPDHHLAGPFLPQTPLGSNTPERYGSPAPPPLGSHPQPKVSPWLRWAIVPSASFKLLIVPLVLWINWELVAPYAKTDISNPFSQFFLLSHPIVGPSPDLRYAKGYKDTLFVVYHIIFWSLIRQLITVKMSRPIAKWFGLRRETKIDRFGEQMYALIYFAVMGAWGYRIMGQLPTWWYHTKYFWIGYPHWDMKPELKRYYLMQSAYWCQQFLVLILGLEKPRKDYKELVAHHFVTLWLIGWSYFLNFTLIGNAVYMSMDIPDTFLAFSKLLNYIQWDRAKIFAFVIFIFIWTYFRHYLNIVILYSVWTEFEFVPEVARIWSFADGYYLPDWMRYQVFAPILLLQFLNLFWYYYFIMRILYRAIVHFKADDDRSEDEGDDEPTKEE